MEDEGCYYDQLEDINVNVFYDKVLDILVILVMFLNGSEMLWFKKNYDQKKITFISSTHESLCMDNSLKLLHLKNWVLFWRTLYMENAWRNLPGCSFTMYDWSILVSHAQITWQYVVIPNYFHYYSSLKVNQEKNVHKFYDCKLNGYTKTIISSETMSDDTTILNGNIGKKRNR